MEGLEGKSMAFGPGRSMNSDRDRRRCRRQRAPADAGDPFGIFWISGVTMVGTFVVVILLYWRFLTY